MKLAHMEKLIATAVAAVIVGLLAFGTAPVYGQGQQNISTTRQAQYANPANVNMTAANITAGVATGRVALPANTATYPTLYLFNSGAVPLFFNLGNNTVVAAVTNVPLPAGATICLAAGTATNLAAITASSTAVLYVVQSQGCPSR